MHPDAGAADAGGISSQWFSLHAPGALAAARFLLPACRRSPSLAFYANAYLTMALSVHLIVEMFCEQFPKTLTRRSVLSLAELRRRLGRDATPRRAVA